MENGAPLVLRKEVNKELHVEKASCVSAVIGTPYLIDDLWDFGASRKSRRHLLPAMSSGGSGARCSRGRREAIPKPLKPDHTCRGVEQNIGRLDVLVNEPPFVQSAECGREANGNSQERYEFRRSREEPVKRFTTSNHGGWSRLAQLVTRPPWSQPSPYLYTA